MVITIVICLSSDSQAEDAANQQLVLVLKVACELQLEVFNCPIAISNHY